MRKFILPFSLNHDPLYAAEASYFFLNKKVGKKSRKEICFHHTGQNTLTRISFQPTTPRFHAYIQSLNTLEVTIN